MNKTANIPVVGKSEEEELLETLEIMRDVHKKEELLNLQAEEEKRRKIEIKDMRRLYDISRIRVLSYVLGIEKPILEKLRCDKLAVLEKKAMPAIQKKAKRAKYLPRIIGSFYFICGALGVFMGIDWALLATWFGLGLILVGLTSCICAQSSCKEFIESREYLLKSGALSEEKEFVNE